MTKNQPASARAPRFPAEYGTPEEPNDLLIWEEVEKEITQARNYWLASRSPSGKPHVRPVDGVWLQGALCFGGSPETRWVRNLQADPRVSVNLPSDELAVILEGKAELISDPSHPLAAASAAASREKYPQYYQDGQDLPFHPFWVLRPRVVFAWTLTGFPNRATRWRFES